MNAIIFLQFFKFWIPNEYEKNTWSLKQKYSKTRESSKSEKKETSSNFPRYLIKKKLRMINKVKKIETNVKTKRYN